MGLKMGTSNKITAERFHAIKGALGHGLDDVRVMADFGIKATTLRHIKRSKTYYEYRLRTEYIPAARKMPQVVAEQSGLAFEDYMPTRKQVVRYKAEKADREAAHTAWAFGIWALTAMIVMIIGIICVFILLTQR